MSIKSRLFWSIPLVISTMFTMNADAKEGMWQPSKIKQQEKEMQRLGLQISTEELYNEAGTGLNNAVVHFGGGCTGEFVSEKGLIFTNHHCAYGNVQGLSTTENNYFKDGFFAKSIEQEIPCPGLTIQIVKKLENVTDYILKGIADSLSEDERNKIINQRIKDYEKAYTRLNKGTEAQIKPYYEGNEYWVTIKQTYEDVRLVAFPPNGIGKFGADTDNWMWPRHTGDFAVLRVYAGANNEPAPYSATNKPYKPVKYFPISTAGVQEGDFTMVYGFPGKTTQYLSSQQVEQVEQTIDPIRITARTKKLDVWNEAMKHDESTFIKYAAKQSSVANGWKKWQGEVLGLSENKVVAKKEKIEARFEQAVANAGTTTEKNILPTMQALIKGNNEVVKASEFVRETVLGIETISQSAVLHQIMNVYRSNISDVALADTLQKIQKRTTGFYKNYLPSLDKEVFKALMPYYLDQDNNIVPQSLRITYAENGNNIDRWANRVYSSSIIANKEKFDALVSNANRADSNEILVDQAYVIFDKVNTFNKNMITPVLKEYNDKLQPVYRQFVGAQMKYNPARKPLYPDANSTLRIAYGNVSPIALKEGNFFLTTLDQVIAKHNPNLEEFNVPQRLLDLYTTKKFGKWGFNGSVPVNFIASNHTTGGNSGSPVLNAKGQLIGINFDRIWQGTMSDIYFDDAYCRNIAVDVRYVLFILEQYGNSNYLFKEFKLVK